MQSVTVYIDSREKANAHIVNGLDEMGVKYEVRKLDIGDYSFAVEDVSFVLSYIFERKSGVDELYGNIMERTKDHTNRLVKELTCAARYIKATVLLVEGVPSMQAINDYCVPAWQMQAHARRIRVDIGKPVYTFLEAWQRKHANFRVVCIADKTDAAEVILDGFWRWYQGYMNAIRPRRGRKKAVTKKEVENKA